MDEQSDPGPEVLIVEHVIRSGWDGPGLIRGYCWSGQDEAIRRCKGLTPLGEFAVAVRPYNRRTRIWLDTNEPAFKDIV